MVLFGFFDFENVLALLLSNGRRHLLCAALQVSRRIARRCVRRPSGFSAGKNKDKSCSSRVRLINFVFIFVSRLCLFCLPDSRNVFVHFLLPTVCVDIVVFCFSADRITAAFLFRGSWKFVSSTSSACMNARVSGHIKKKKNPRNRASVSCKKKTKNKKKLCMTFVRGDAYFICKIKKNKKREGPRSGDGFLCCTFFFFLDIFRVPGRVSVVFRISV